MVNGEVKKRSKIKTLIFLKMFKWLDNPKRKSKENPQLLVDSAMIKEGQTVLEVGCGTGYFTEVISSHIGEKGKLYSIDNERLSVETTKKRVMGLGLKNVVVMEVDATKTTFEKENFDGVLIYGVLPSFAVTTEDMVREAYKALKPGGVCAIWTIAPLWSPQKAMALVGFDYIGKTNGVHRGVKS